MAAVILAGQGEIKTQPISEGGMPRLRAVWRLTVRAASSTGATSGRTLSSSWGKRTRISRSTAGQAEEMTGRSSAPWLSSSRVASLTSSAAVATS